jgi:peptide/nickel transport system substrate-binding protein
MAENTLRRILVVLSLLLESSLAPGAWSPGTQSTAATASSSKVEYLTVPGLTGKSGGTLIIARRSEPKTLNPVVAIDGTSKELIGLITADLIHINRYTQQTEPALATSWKISHDGRVFTVNLRRGVRFSDGYPFDAEDVLFTFRVYLDEQTHAPQRDLLTVGGTPIAVRKIDPYTVVFTLAQPYAAAERLFDSIAILPKHLLEGICDQGKLARAWTVSTPPTQFAGLGPFQLQEYIPGQKIIFQRNRFYWKRDVEGNQLPYLDRVISVAAPTPETQEIRFQSGEIDLISRFDAQDFSTLEKNAGSAFRVYDAGPGLEYTFLLFNLNDEALPEARLPVEKQRWFRQAAFRQAVSHIVDRDAMVRLGYSGRAHSLSVQISPGNRKWLNPVIPSPTRSAEQSKEILRGAHFSWAADGSLKDPYGKTVGFSIMFNSANSQHERLAAIAQQDLKELGIQANIVPMDFKTLVDRVFNKLSYDTAIMTLADGDADPNTEMNVLLSGGQAHLWRLRSRSGPEQWEEQVDQLMKEQMTALDPTRRKQIFDRVQEIIWQQQPVVFLLSPNILAGANNRVGNFRPAVLSSYTLWNAEQLFIRSPGRAGTL